jgi:OOP family OmpA-OmpF porin
MTAARLAVLGLAVLAVGCGAEIKGRLRAVKATIQQARDHGAYRCAPRELALAETHAEFTEDELAYGNAVGAHDELEVADRNARLALAGSPEETCAPKVAIIERPAPVVTITALDTDADGVLDSADRCPTTPGPKDNDGCPYTDRDHDTVVDKDDKCPDLAGPVENAGCPWPDRDRDGVLDKDDRCPDEAGPHENGGCPYKLIVVTKEKIQLRQKVFFDTDKATIKPASHEMLGEIADLLVKNGTMVVRIEGHTDSRAGLAHNMKLSQSRANAVRRYLISRGVDPTKLTSIGYGPTRPIDDNRTSVGREANRRVEFIITGR